MKKDKNQTVDSSAGPRSQMSETEIDKTLNGSFPASDPPSWTLGTDHREETESVKDKPAGGALEE